MREFRTNSEITHHIPFPENSNASREKVITDTALWRESLVSGEWREYEATLPTIIGEVPHKERDAFTNLFSTTGDQLLDYSSTGSPWEEGKKSWLEANLPQTMNLVREDINAFKDPNNKLAMLSLQKTEIRSGEAPITDFKSDEWHIDFTKYLISNDATTQVYSGALVRAKYVDPDFADIALDTNKGHVLDLPQFAIVRKGPWDVHRSPTVKVPTTRAFMTFITTDGITEA